jgi:hypothetical protein
MKQADTTDEGGIFFNPEFRPDIPDREAIQLLEIDAVIDDFVLATKEGVAVTIDSLVAEETATMASERRPNSRALRGDANGLK